MNSHDLTKNAKGVAFEYGADLVGIVRVVDLPEHTESIAKILPAPQSVMVIAAKHSLGAIRSSNIQVAQFDTINAYEQCAKAAHRASRYLESEGFLSVAVPAFIPIDMGEPKKGMKGEINKNYQSLQFPLGWSTVSYRGTWGQAE